MAYTLPTFVDNSVPVSPPSPTGPAVDAASLNEYTTAITDLDTNRGLTAVAKQTSAYTAAPGQFVPVDTTSGAVTVTLPTAPANNATIAVKMVIQGSTNAATVACGGSDVINKTGGSTTFPLTTLNQGVVLQYKSSGAIWYAITSDLSLGQLDLRYATPSFATSRAVALAMVLGS